MSDAITNALANAKATADQTPEPDHNSGYVPATTEAPSLPAASAGGAPRSLTDFLASATMNVDAYLSVNEYGITFGKDKQLHDHVDVEMVFKNAKFGYILRVNTPGGVQYFTSWDGRTEVKTRKNWAAMIEEAKAVDPKSYPSDVVELPVKALASYGRKEGGPFEEGKVIGLSLSYQNAKAFSAFLQEQFPRVGMETPIRVRIGYSPKKSSGGIEYAVFTYKVITDDEAAAAPAKAGGKKAA